MARKVLVVDDEPGVVRSTCALLEDLGFAAVSVDDPDRIVDAMRAERPDLVLQDVRMPGLDLDALVATIRADADLAHVPIILFSASMEIQDVAERIRVADWLEKPFRPADLLRALHAVAP